MDCGDPTYTNFLLQQYEERIEKLSQQDKLGKFCMDAGFLSVVENGQYFMTKDTGDLTQFNTVACREYTLPREDSTSQPKGCKYGMELRSEVCLGVEAILTPGSEFLMDQISL